MVTDEPLSREQQVASSSVITRSRAMDNLVC
jgi:hypothetical protein